MAKIDENGHAVTFHDPKTLGIAMAEGRHMPHPLHDSHTGNEVRKNKQGTGELDSAHYTGGRYPGDKV